MPDSIADTSIGEEQAQANPEEPDVIQGEAPTADSEGTSLTEILLADAPDDDGSYQSHALNWDGEESTGKIIRGFEGMAGNLNKALILIAMGAIQKFSEYQDNGEEEGDGEDQSENLEGELEHEAGEDGFQEI